MNKLANFKRTNFASSAVGQLALQKKTYCGAINWSIT